MSTELKGKDVGFLTELKKIVAKNIADLRHEAGMTQLELAEKLNYSDKAVSKWESGASIPDVGVLLEISRLFGVTVDYLLSEDHRIPVKAIMKETVKGRKHLIITLLSVALVWLIATVVFVVLNLVGAWGATWLLFIYAIPVSAVVLIVFNSIWGKRRQNYLYISILMWSVLSAVYLSLIAYNFWLLFTIGIPGQIIICLWAGMKKPQGEK
ncbi:MAG: helix-turn-helix transcriptional regulator [Ruminococcaceae bacterium]|nr:helix-turn-helix transcriptional regulator [Oscillospiraceae bacterium]